MINEYVWYNNIPSALSSSSNNDVTSCSAIRRLDPFAPSGMYTIRPKNVARYRVYCEMKTNGGGWTLVSKAKTQRGTNGVNGANFLKDDTVSSSTVTSSKISGIVTSTPIQLAPWICYWKYISIELGQNVAKKETATREYYDRVGKDVGHSWGCGVVSSSSKFSEQIPKFEKF